MLIIPLELRLSPFTCAWPQKLDIQPLDSDNVLIAHYVWDMKNLPLLLFCWVGAGAMIAMSWHYIVQENTGILDGKLIADQAWYQAVFRTHVLGGLVAIATGPFQFLRRLRLAFPKLHRRLGYVYTLSVVSSGLAGGLVAPHAMGGAVAQIGFLVLSILWLGTLYLSINAIRKGKVVVHQRWITLNYALTFAAITQRTMLLLPLLGLTPFLPVYRLSAWLPWLINLSIAWLILGRVSGNNPSMRYYAE